MLSLRFLYIFRILLKCSTILCLLAIAQNSRSENEVSRGVPQSQIGQSCEIVTESKPPFLIADPGFGQTTISSNLKSVNMTATGYIPRNSIVEVQPSDQGFIQSHLPGAMINIKVLSVPEIEKSQLDHTTGKISTAGIGTGQRASVGSVGQIAASSLIPAVGAFKTPGSFMDSQKTVFLVRKDTPYFNNPALEGRAVRLAQYGTSYLAKRCCPVGTPTESFYENVVGLVTKYKRESKRNSACTYSPVFDLLKDTAGVDSPDFEVEKQFTSGTCNAFIASLQPMGTKNLKQVLALGGNLNRLTNQTINRMQSTAFQTVMNTLCYTRRGRRVCVGGGNRSKGICRVGVRQNLAEIYGLTNTPPGESAVDMHPWLGQQSFENLIDKFKTSTAAPPGSILVYKSVNDPGHPHGHVEIKVDNDSYCSDYCADYPIDKGRIFNKRVLVGVYLRKENL